MTIVATDERGLSKSRDVVITVVDSDDAGSINLSTRQPQIGRSITASLDDKDGVEGSITWAVDNLHGPRRRCIMSLPIQFRLAPTITGGACRQGYQSDLHALTDG